MSELSPQTLIEKYLSKTLIMQLATSRDGQPWICNLHFVADKDSNIYWLTKTTARHSQDIEHNPKTAIAIAVQTEKPLIGIQIEGNSGVLTDMEEVRSIMDLYIERHGTDRKFADSIITGSNEHKLYKLTPIFFSLFDQVNFADQPLQTWVIN